MLAAAMAGEGAEPGSCLTFLHGQRSAHNSRELHLFAYVPLAPAERRFVFGALEWESSRGARRLAGTPRATVGLVGFEDRHAAGRDGERSRRLIMHGGFHDGVLPAGLDGVERVALSRSAWDVLGCCFI